MLDVPLTPNHPLPSPSKTPPYEDSVPESSYGEILKSSSIIGGAQGINYLIAMIRGKAVAVLLGPSGVGLVGMYSTALGFVGTIAGLGIGSSAVREIAEAVGAEDEIRLARSIKVLRRTVWVTGMLGWALTAAFAWPLSRWAFGSHHYAWALVILGSTLLFSAISAGQTAILQGRRRIGDLARLSIASTVVGTLCSIGLYAWLHERGIVPVLIVTGLTSLGASWWYARRVDTASIQLSWLETGADAKRMIQFGLSFMWSGVLVHGTTLAIRSLIVRDLGLDASGIYQSAWSLSGMFAGFILGAMGTDFYPRLTAFANNKEKMNRLVNEQMQVGILLALPGLIGTLMFSPLIIRMFFSAKFLEGAVLLPWFVIGVFGRVVSWPMALIMQAKGEGRWFALSETAANILHLLLVFWLIRLVGLWGASLAFALLYLLYAVSVMMISNHLTNFTCSNKVLQLILIGSLLIATGFLIQYSTQEPITIMSGFLLTVGTLAFTIRSICTLLGSNHRLVAAIRRMPGHSFLLPK